MHEKRLKIVEYDPDFNKKGNKFYLKQISSRRRMAQNILKSIISSVCLIWEFDTSSLVRLRTHMDRLMIGKGNDSRSINGDYHTNWCKWPMIY